MFDNNLKMIPPGATLRKIRSITMTDPAEDAAVTLEIVDAYDGVIITTTEAGNAQTITDPTNVLLNREFIVANTAASTHLIIVNSVVIEPGEAQKFFWDGSTWVTLEAVSADQISFTPAGNILATDVQAAIEAADQNAGEVPFTPAGNISSTTVQAAIEEVATDALPTALTIADLSDSATPSVLTIVETTNKTISNYQETAADHEFIMPAAHINGSIIFVVGAAFQVDITPDSGANFYLNGAALAADESIQNTSDVLGEELVGYIANIEGTLTWMFKSGSSNFVGAGA